MSCVLCKPTSLEGMLPFAIIPLHDGKVVPLQVKMVTGDPLAIAVETCRSLGMGTNIMEGAELMQHKSEDLSFARQARLCCTLHTFAITIIALQGQHGLGKRLLQL